VSRSKSHTFDGGAATFLGTGILALLITVCTLGICYPFAIVLKQRWRAKHTYINGHRLEFTGSATGLFFNWVKWLGLSIITFGIYLFWVGPRIQRWVVEHTDFDPSWRMPAAVGAHINVAVSAPIHQLPLPVQAPPGEYSAPVLPPTASN
jgi:hypothetical protein